MSRWKYDVFLSHHSDDKPDVARLADVLQRQGVKPWLDTWNLVVGDPWQPKSANQAMHASGDRSVAGPAEREEERG